MDAHNLNLMILLSTHLRLVLFMLIVLLGVILGLALFFRRYQPVLSHEHDIPHDVSEKSARTETTVLEQLGRMEDRMIGYDKNIKLLNATITRMQSQFFQISESINTLTSSPQPQQKNSSSSNITYSYALNLLKDGMSIEEVTQKCHLSHSEADVLLALFERNSGS
jgi:hypothetical protein